MLKMMILLSRYRGIVVVEMLILHSTYRRIVPIQENFTQKCAVVENWQVSIGSAVKKRGVKYLCCSILDTQVGYF